LNPQTLSACLSMHLCIPLPICLPVYLPIHLSMYTYLCIICIYKPIYVSMQMPFHVPIYYATRTVLYHVRYCIIQYHAGRYPYCNTPRREARGNAGQFLPQHPPRSAPVSHDGAGPWVNECAQPRARGHRGLDLKIDPQEPCALNCPPGTLGLNLKSHVRLGPGAPGVRPSPQCGGGRTHQGQQLHSAWQPGGGLGACGGHGPAAWHRHKTTRF